MSLTSDDLADIKQLMTAVIRAEISGVHEEIDGLRKEMNQRFDEVDRRFEEVNQRFKAIDRRFDENAEVQNEILNAIGTDLNRHSARLDDHDDRLRRLEQRAA